MLGDKVFQNLVLWMDPVKRSGPEAMAVDEWLMEHSSVPVCRVYGWAGDWGTVGYFGNLDHAKEVFPGVSWVRRWTGGGTVDHRADWTYTIFAPVGERLAQERGDGSYSWIHAALVEALVAEGIPARLSRGDEETGAAACFENPVNHDVVGAGGVKLAGAGQRRSKLGLLHQGSVAGVCEGEGSWMRAQALATALADEWVVQEFFPPSERIEEMIRARYASNEWTNRR